MSELNLQIRYKHVKNLSIRIKPDGTVIVTAPIWIDKSQISHFIQSKSAWIEKHTTNFKEARSNPITNNSILYLGNYYLKQIIYAESDEIKIFATTVQIHTPHIHDDKHISQLIDAWYLQQAQQVFVDLLNKYQPCVNKPVYHLSIKKMTSRWGSCNHSKGYINLNIELIKKPLPAIEYVVLHELVHLIHPNHSHNFYNYLAKYMPNWQQCKNMLKQI